MSDWQEVVEEGQVFWVHESLGNVVKSGEMYMAMLPKVIRLGPFDTLEQAQQALEVNRSSLDQVLTGFNHDLINLCKSLKR